MINRKLDLLLNTLGAQKQGFNSLPVRQINISGGGLSFPSPEPFTRGDVVEVMMVLASSASVALYVYGEVVAVDRRNDGFEIGLKFVAMGDQIREEICRFVFERERQILREKRG
jgi:c-di-GMP-binding flagellar brake protein YcgR